MMRTILRRAAVAAVAAALVATPAVPAHAASTSGTSPDGLVSVQVAVRDVKNLPGYTTDAQWVQVTIDGPDAYISSGGNAFQAYYGIVVETSGASCGIAQTTTRREQGDGTFYVPLKMTNYSFRDEFTKPGKCAVKVTVQGSRDLFSAPEANFTSTVVTGTHMFVRNATSLSKPRASSAKVSKGKKVTLRGTAERTVTSRTKHYEQGALKRGTRLVLQQKAAGAKSWKKVRTVKVGSKGRWSVAVKPRKTTRYRVVVAQTSTLLGDVSSPVKVTVRR
jgi:hypothetical protein